MILQQLYKYEHLISVAMQTLDIKQLRHPSVTIPASILNEIDSSINLIGYYVENTQHYNIVPMDANIKSTLVCQIGKIFSSLELSHGIISSALINKLNDFIREKTTRPSKNRLTRGAASYIKIDRTSNLFTFDSLPKLFGYWNEGELYIFEAFMASENDQEIILTPVKQDVYSLKLDLFSRNTGILESGVMLKKKALFVGCGSVGSLVAVELAKAGVGHFMLVDNDIFGYHNICRHQCGIYDVGRYKTDALADRIYAINPYAEVVKYNLPIEDVDRDAILSFCNDDTVIVGGADNREGDLYACNLGIQANAAFVSIGCWERAFAGEIFYCLPKGTPTYKDFLSVTGYVSGRVTQNRRFYTTEEDLEKVSFEPGISADINFVTIVGVKLILDLLNRDDNEYTQRILPHLTQYTLVCNTNDTKIGGEQAEIFSYPLQVTTSIIVPYAEDRNEPMQIK
jgi:molybdopterin/thiamine biosynthesis adenylyltransferase